LIMLTLRIKEAEIRQGEIVIKKLCIFDKLSGEELRIAEINEDLLKLFKLLEIDITKFMEVQKMFKKNPDIKLLVETFDLRMINE